MALRLQLQGYTIRWATYSDGGFKGGVSLTCDDELNRWQKCAYGFNELIFNPLVEWWKKGPINAQLRTFVWSAEPVHYKINMMSYMFWCCKSRPSFPPLCIFFQLPIFEDENVNADERVVPLLQTVSQQAPRFHLALMNYLLLGWSLGVNGFFLHSFEIWLACTVVFSGAGNLGFTLLEYGLGHRPLLDSLWENLSWVPFLYVIFFTSYTAC